MNFSLSIWCRLGLDARTIYTLNTLQIHRDKFMYAMGLNSILLIRLNAQAASHSDPSRIFCDFWTVMRNYFLISYNSIYAQYFRYYFIFLLTLLQEDTSNISNSSKNNNSHSKYYKIITINSTQPLKYESIDLITW